MRLNKYISHNSKYSRREADREIEAGNVIVDKKVITDFSFDVLDGMKVSVRGQYVNPQNIFTVIVYNKQKGELVTKKDDRGRKTIYDTLPKKFAHFLPVGRLDFQSEGLLLMSDSPRVVEFFMTQPFDRVYNLKIDGEITEAMTQAMKDGLELEDATAGGHSHSAITSMHFAPFNYWQIAKNTRNFSKIRVSISEGKNRELRRFFAHFGREVLDLKRIAYGKFELNSLPSGKTRFFSQKEYQELREVLKG
jgi:23S rRNA pseudouridine2605 synthase